MEQFLLTGPTSRESAGFCKKELSDSCLGGILKWADVLLPSWVSAFTPGTLLLSMVSLTTNSKGGNACFLQGTRALAAKDKLGNQNPLAEKAAPVL